MRMQRFGLFVLLAASCMAALAQKPAPHGGQWWKDKSGTYREAFVAGFKSGAHHQANGDTGLSKFTSSVLTAGVDKFYNDFRNANIRVDDALQFVADQLSGVPDDQLKTRLLKLRSAAAGNAEED